MEKKTDDKDVALDAFRVLLTVVITGVLAMIAMVLSSCSSRPRVEYLTKESAIEVHDTLFRDREVVLRDSIFIRSEASVSRRDSIAPIVDSLNRVIGYDRWHYEKIVENGERNVERYKAQMDSLRKVVESGELSVERDVVEVVKEANRIHWWQRGLMWVGGLALVGAMIVAVVKIYPLLRRW